MIGSEDAAPLAEYLIERARDCRHGHLARSCGLCEYDRLAAAARDLLDAVVWRSDGPDVPEGVDLRGVTAAQVRALEEALP